MSPVKQIVLMLLILALLPLVFRLVVRLLVKLRLLPLVLYLLAVRFFFPGWAAAHELLCIGLLAAIIAGTLATWLAPLIVRLKEEHRAKEVLCSELQFARERGSSTNDYHFVVHNGIPILEYDK